MNQSLTPVEVEAAIEAAEKVELQKLSEKHKQVAALLAQGLDRVTISQAVGYTPQYVTWLQGQPLFRAYVKEMTAAVAVRLEALFEQSVDTIATTMGSGTPDERLRAAKLQLEATGRIGRFQTPLKEHEGSDKLEVLADRLKSLLYRQRRTVNGEVQDAEIVGESKRVLQGE